MGKELCRHPNTQSILLTSQANSVGTLAIARCYTYGCSADIITVSGQDSGLPGLVDGQEAAPVESWHDGLLGYMGGSHAARDRAEKQMAALGLQVHDLYPTVATRWHGAPHGLLTLLFAPPLPSLRSDALPLTSTAIYDTMS